MTIENEFGRNAVNTLKQWISRGKRYKKAPTHVDFLLRCRTLDLRPKHIQQIDKNLKHFQFENTKVNSKMQRKLEQFKTTILNLEIQEYHYKLSLLKKNLKEIENTIEHLLPTEIQKPFYDTQLITLNKIYDTSQDIKYKKIRELSPETGNYQ